MQRILLALFVLVVAGLGAGAWWLVRGNAAVRVVPIEPSTATGAAGSTASARAPSEPVLGTAPAETVAADTTVVIPLEVEMELVHADAAVQGEGAAALGSGAKAHLAGTILDVQGHGTRAEVEFVAGPNEGRVLYCDGSGLFGAQDLYPGLSVVRVSGPAIIGSQREVRLRQERDELLNISYLRPAHVTGTVFDAQGKPLAEAKVSFDGQDTVTDDKGTFDLQAVAPGKALVIVSKPGFAAHRESVDVAVNGRPDAARLQFRLEPAARLQVSIVEPINATEDAWLYLLPNGDNAERKFPWQSVNPVRVRPGGSVTIPDLPAGMVSLRLFHAGAVAKPAQSVAMLGPGDTAVAELHLEPAPVVQGVVTDGGKPASGAQVVLEAPDRAQAMLSVFGASNYLYLENDVFPNLPPAVQKVVSDARGEFVLNANESASAVRYLTATSQDGKRVAHAVLKAGDKRVDLALEPVQSGSGSLRIATNARFQPLPVKVTVDGTPREPSMLPPGRDLSVEALPRGSWLVTVRWNGTDLVKRAPLQIDKEVSLDVKLPQGAIDGQDADTIQRTRGRR